MTGIIKKDSGQKTVSPMGCFAKIFLESYIAIFGMVLSRPLLEEPTVVIPMAIPGNT